MSLSHSAATAESRELVRLSTEELREFRDRERAVYEAIKSRATPFNLARGKPATEQVELANRLLTAVGTPKECWAEDGTDCRNYYGSPQGLIEARRLFAPMLGAPPEQVLVANNSSLALMHDAFVYALLTGTRDGAVPWRDQRQPTRFLCPSPGYDRHFQICEQYGVEMIPVALTGAGPDMDEVERLAGDPAVKGMWCVPKYSSPTGETYSSETVAWLARMRATDDFRPFWDNAYAVHHLSGTPARLRTPAGWPSNSPPCGKWSRPDSAAEESRRGPTRAAAISSAWTCSTAAPNASWRWPGRPASGWWRRAAPFPTAVIRATATSVSPHPSRRRTRSVLRLTRSPPASSSPPANACSPTAASMLETDCRGARDPCKPNPSTGFLPSATVGDGACRAFGKAGW